jgi:site-specific DNA-cytosine methylase
LRDGVPTVAALCLILRDDDGTLAAAIRYWPAEVDGADVLLLGPVAVHPTRQSEGLGGVLINESLVEARRLGWERVLLVGDAPYYSRFGFAVLPGAVRRLTPTECERLMGFPDDFTRIPYRGKTADNCPDGPRYKALGNSWAVNCADWIAERIDQVDAW